MPGGWQKKLLRLSSRGFHLVIFPLGIHTTSLPPEASCLNTDSPKETSHCHFNSHTRRSLSCSHFSIFPSCPSTYFLLILFYVAFLPVPPCVSPCTVFFFSPGSLIVCAFLIVSEQMLSVVTAVETAAGAICGEQLIWQRSQGRIHNNILLPLGLTRLSGFMSGRVAQKHKCTLFYTGYV